MVRIRTAAIVRTVTAVAGIRSIVVIAVYVAKCAIIRNTSMRTGQWVNHIVVKGGRSPGSLRMTQRTVGRKLRYRVVRICRTRVFCIVATVTSVWGIVVIAIVAHRTIIRNRCVRSIEMVIIIVDREQRRLPARRSRMTTLTIRWKP